MVVLLLLANSGPERPSAYCSRRHSFCGGIRREPRQAARPGMVTVWDERSAIPRVLYINISDRSEQMGSLQIALWSEVECVVEHVLCHQYVICLSLSGFLLSVICKASPWEAGLHCSLPCGIRKNLRLPSSYRLSCATMPRYTNRSNLSLCSQLSRCMWPSGRKRVRSLQLSIWLALQQVRAAHPDDAWRGQGFL